MKKFLLVFCVLAVMAMSVGCKNVKTKLPEGFAEEQVKAQAEEDIKLGESDNYEGWIARFEPSLQSQISEDAYRSYLEIVKEMGGFREFGKIAFVGQEQDGKKYAAVIYLVKYENGEIKYTVGYDEEMNLVQFLAQ